MKLNISSSLAIAVLLAAPVAQADSLYWDGGTANWGATTAWSTDSSNIALDPGATPVITDDVFFSSTSAAADSIVHLNSDRGAKSLTFSTSFDTILRSATGVTNWALNLGSGGITVNSGSGVVTIGQTPASFGTLTTVLNASQSWTHDDDSLFTVVGPVNLGANTLTLAGSGTGGTTLSGVISGTGAVKVNRSGSGVVTFGGANSFTGQLSVERGVLSIASINGASANGTLGNSALSVILGSSGGNTGALSYTGGNATSTKRFTFAAGGTGEINVSTGATILTLSGLLDGSGGLSKTGTGTLTLSNINQFTGNTVITNGKVALGGQFGLWQSAYDTTGSDGTIGLNVTGQANPWLGGLAGSVNLATAITGYGSVASLNLNPQSGSSVSYGGVIANGAANMTLNKTGHGTQTLTGANSYSGATTVWAGTLALSGASGTALNSAFTVRGGTLELDNSTNLVASRLTDGTALSLGSMTLKGFNTGGVQGETVGATTFAVGGKVTVINGSTAGDRTDLTMGAVTRSTGAAIDFVGGGLGTLGGGADSPNVTGSGAGIANTNSILPWATVNGTSWAQNDGGGSIRAATGITYYDPTTEGTDSNKHAQLNGVAGVSSLASAKAFSSLNVITSGSGQSLNLASGANLNLTTGAILKSGTEAYTISSGGGILGAGATGTGTELIAHVAGGALTISAPLNAVINSIAKGGTGDLILSGTRKADFNGNTSIAGGQLEFQGAGFSINGVVTGAGGLTVNLNAGQTLLLNSNSNSYAGPTIVKGGYLSESGYTNIGIPGGRYQTPNTNTSLIMSNLILQGGVWYSRYTTNKDLGAGPGQVQILAGTSGFVHDAGTGGAASLILDGGRELVWGSTYFNPTVFVHSTIGNLTLNLANGFDLAGSTRTVLVGDATYNALAGGGSSQLGGVIRDSIGSAGLTKTGVGILLLTGANTFNGAVTVSQGTLAFSGNANVASPNPLGQSSAAASNLLLANGTTLKYTGGAASTDRSFTINGTADGHGASLDASGTGAINFTNTSSPAYGTVDQTRTLTLTGSYAAGNNILAANIADNGTGAVSVTKTGAGLWVLSGTNNYGGVTTVNAGTLVITKEAALASNTAAKLNVKSGAALQLNVDSAGSAGFTSANLGTLLGNISVANTAEQGLQGGANLVIDTATATGGTFTPSGAITNSTGDFGGVIKLTKIGAGTLIFDQANTYTGSTTISAGTLQLNAGGVIATPIGNNATFAINSAGAVTQGTHFGLIAGTGAVTNAGAGTLTLNLANIHTGTTTPNAGNITLNHALAIQNSALDTTGAGSVTLGAGVTSPTIGGLANSGTTRDLASVIDSSFANVTNLTLNPNAGSVTYGGVIADGSAPMSLTKTGAGTQILQGANAYTGATNIRAGTLTLSGASGSLASDTLNLYGGGLTLDNATNSGTRISDSAAINVNGNSALTFSHGGTAGVNYAETIDTLSLQSGFLTYTGSQANATGPRTSNVQFNTLSRTGASNTSAVNFAGTGLGAVDGRNTIKFSAGVTDATDLGPWAVVNGADFATYDTARGIKAAANSTLLVDSSSNTTNWKLTGGNIAITGGTNPSYKTLLISDTSARTLTTTGNTVSLGGISSIGQTHIINGTGVLQALTAGDALYINVGANTLQIDSVIQNVGAGATATTLVKSGSGALTLNNAANTYSGGTVINGPGSINVNGAIDPFGAAGSTVTVNTTFNLANTGSGAATFNRPFELNNGAIINFTNGNNPFTITGAVTGTGGVSPQTAGGIEQRTLSLTSTANTFTGPINLNWDGGNNSTISVNSLSDAAGAGAINLVGGTSSQFMWGTGAGAPLTLDNRQFVITSSTAGANLLIKNANTASSHANIITVNTDLLVTGSGAKTLTLTGANTGNNTFAGKITDGPGAVVSLTKADTGTWVVTGANTYTGATTVSGGTLQISSLANAGLASSIGASSNAAANLILSGGTLRYTGAAVSTARLFSLQASSTLDSSGTGAINFTNTGLMGFNGGTAAKTLTLTGANTGNNTIAAVIGDLTAATALVKNGIGTWVLGGVSNSYTGTTTLNTGRLVLDYAASNATKLANGAALTLGGGTLELSGGSHTEIVASTTLTNNTGTRITQTNSGTSVLQLGAITRSNGGSTLSFSADNIATTNNTNTNGILGPGYTVGSHWAVNSTNLANGSIIALSSYTTTVPTITGINTENYQLTGSQNQTGTTVGNTLRIINSADDDVLNLNTFNFDLNSANGVMGAMLYAGGANNSYTISGSGAIKAATGNNHLGVNVFTGTLTVNALLGAGTGNVTKWGAGTLVIGSNNAGLGGAHFVQEGTLRLANNGAAGTNAGGIVVSNGAALELSNSVAIATEALTISGYGISNAGALRNVAGNTSSYAGAITLNTATSVGGARINSDAGGELTLTGGVVTSKFNDLTLGGDGNTTVSSVAISGAGGLIKDGAGTATLSATNTYTGPTAVTGGTLLINGTHTGGGLITVYSTATLGGSGTMKDVVIEGDGTLAPGNSAGQITTTGNLILNDTSNLEFELTLDDPWVSGAPTTSDYVSVGNGVPFAGNLTLDGKLKVTALNLFTTPNVGEKWLLMSYTGVLTNNGLVLDSAPSGASYVIDTATDGSVFLAVVPEAGTAGLMALGLLLLRRLRRGRAD